MTSTAPSNNVETDTIVLYPILENEQITLKVKHDYRLHKLNVSVFKLRVENNNLLSHLTDIHHQILTDLDNVIVLHTCCSDKGLNIALMVLNDALVLNKDDILCRIVYTKPFKQETKAVIENLPSSSSSSSSLQPISVEEPSSTSSIDFTFQLSPVARRKNSKISIFDKYAVES
ncbi:tlp20 [Spodoptera litura granulovirus]|uniref:Tlp20 n=1 Tax=Spodoptera litura granulovirus TaxID=359919 RepID=A5IZU5_9BBAC|nr:tlp20 [Spodoptera litura granulovirus]ABQ52036.1 tlp20 [Spodoptera litura granulovirus]